MKRALKDPIFVSIVLCGLTLTIALATMVRRNTEESATLWLAERAEWIELATEESVARSLADLRAVAAFLTTTEGVTQQDFNNFVAQMEMNPGVVGIGYLPIVPHAELAEFLDDTRHDVPTFDLQSFNGQGGIGPDNTVRSVYYPMRYVHGGPFMDIVISQTPIETQTESLGFDLGSEPMWYPTFEKMLASPEASVSDLVSVGGTFPQNAFAAAHPIVDDAGDTVGILVAPGLETLLTTDLAVAATSNVQWTVDNASPEREDTDWPVWSRHIEFPGTTWHLTVEPTAAALIDLSSPAHWFVAAIGIALTIALASAAYQTRLRRRDAASVDQLHQLSADKDRFLATVSHELRTPLTVVIGLAAELADNGRQFDPNENAELLGMIEQHGQEASSIVEDLLVAARSDIDKIAVNLEPIDLQDAVGLALHASAVEKAPVIGGCAPALADSSRVRQILRNLLTNAARYGGPCVEVRLEESADECTITVADNGAPIAQDHEQAIFDPYVSAHDGGKQLGSIGLGLFISRKLARLMGGELRYHHDGTHGLFELSLPRATANLTRTI